MSFSISQTALLQFCPTKVVIKDYPIRNTIEPDNDSSFKCEYSYSETKDDG